MKELIIIFGMCIILLVALKIVYFWKPKKIDVTKGYLDLKELRNIRK